MKFTKMLGITILLCTISYSQTDNTDNLYNSSSGVTVSVFLPLMYNIGYDFVLNENSSIRTSLYYFSNNSNDRESKSSSQQMNVQYNEWEDSRSSYRIGCSLYYLHDIYKFSNSKFYGGAGMKYDFGEIDSESSRELNILENYHQSSMSEYQDINRMFLDFLLGYELKITDNISVFGEIIYSFSRVNYSITTTDGWNRSFIGIINEQTTGLSPTTSEVNNFSANSRELSLRIGLIFSF
ncbi:MAG: hypothetical protein KKA84_04480 [Bacteroidetes bacterium]|nr:hypothetical protein [Bacteroidota bacterium]